MRRVASGNINLLEYRAGGGCMGLFGLPFLAFGVFAIYGAFLGTWKTKSGAPAGFFPPFFFGMIFGGVGAGFLFGRMGVAVDRTAGTVSKWWGLLMFTLYSKRCDIATARCVAINHEIRRGKNSSYSVYPVRVRDRDDGEALVLCEPRSETDARRLAEEIAQFMNVPLRDSVGGGIVTRAPETLNESVAERIRRTGEDVAITAPPFDAESRVSAEGNRLVIDLPPRPLGCAPLQAIFMTFIAGLFFSMFFSGLLPIFWVWTATGVLGLAGLVAARINAAARWRITADRETLRVTTLGAVWQRSQEMPAAQIEEIRVENRRSGEPSTTFVPLRGSGLRLAALGDRKILRFAEGLSQKELEWLRALLMKALSSQ